MKEITMFKCDICGEIYDTEEKALKCEMQGVENPIANIGDMYECLVGYLEDDLDMPIYMEYKLIDIKINPNSHYVLYYFAEEMDDGNWYECKTIWGNNDFENRCIKIEDGSDYCG